MIDVHSWATGNARKVYIMLEECGLAYRVFPVDLGKGEQFAPAFLKISPNNKTPAIIDHDGPEGGDYSLFESGAILMYLADKTGKFLPVDPHARLHTLQWLMFQMGNLGPMFGQAGHYITKNDDASLHYARAHFLQEAQRLMHVLDARLAQSEYIAGKDYTIADIATYPWCEQPDKRGLEHEDYPNLKRWFDRVSERAAVKKVQLLCEDIREGKI
jgi:GST-like protein